MLNRCSFVYVNGLTADLMFVRQGKFIYVADFRHYFKMLYTEMNTN